jgi:hypothetical protein
MQDQESADTGSRVQLMIDALARSGDRAALERLPTASFQTQTGEIGSTSSDYSTIRTRIRPGGGQDTAGAEGRGQDRGEDRAHRRVRLPLGEQAKAQLVITAAALRAAGVRVDLAYGDRGLKGAMRAANRSGASLALVAGDRDIEIEASTTSTANQEPPQHDSGSTESTTKSISSTTNPALHPCALHPKSPQGRCTQQPQRPIQHPGAGNGNGRPDMHLIRRWARENGIRVPARGRMPAATIRAYDEHRQAQQGQQ